MDLELIIFKSDLHDQEQVFKTRTPLFAFLRNTGSLSIIDSSDYLPHSSSNTEDSPLTICFIATGGTEQKFAAIAEKLPRPFIILSDAYSNSLAASLEIATWLSIRHFEYEFINIPADYKDFGALTLKLSCLELKKNAIFSHLTTHLKYDSHFSASSSQPLLTAIYAQDKVKEYLSKSTIGLIGGESPWLISSKIDEKHIESLYGVKFIHIDTQEIISEYLSLADKEIDSSAITFPQNLEKEVKDALKMYEALSKICKKYSLTALTIKCFDLIEPCRSTACLALSLLNDSGIVAGCEGDIPALWTMMICYALSGGKPSFMANPSSSSEDSYTIDFAHCTVPLTIIGSYTLLSHFESGIGIGIAGIFPKEKCSVIKIGGKNLDKILFLKGNIIANTHISQRCRTQIRVRFDSGDDFREFFSCKVGNHVIITPYLFENL